MAPLGPFAADRRVAVAVSGGADSLALALLAAGWGKVLALVVDHGLRPEAAAEAEITIARLARHDIPARLLKLGLSGGPGMAARAREARHAALAEATRGAGLAQLLLGHHAGDQAETVLLRALHGSGPAGRAGMAAWQAANGICLLRPLLALPRARLRATLGAAGLDWVEDPSNRDQRAERVQLRGLINEPSGVGPHTVALGAAAAHWAARRRAGEEECAAFLARHAVLHADLHVDLPDAPLPPHVLAALVRMVAGSTYPPATSSVLRLAAAPKPATLAGARLLRGPRGWLHLAREEAGMALPVAARPGAVWDGRFRLVSGAAPPGASIGGLAGDAAKLRKHSSLPANLLAVLPAIRAADGRVLAVPHLGIGESGYVLAPAVATPAARIFA